jgi:hypothetical protein
VLKLILIICTINHQTMEVLPITIIIIRIIAIICNPIQVIQHMVERAIICTAILMYNSNIPHMEVQIHILDLSSKGMKDAVVAKSYDDLILLNLFSYYIY